MRQNCFAQEASGRHRAIAQGQTAAQQAGLAFSQLLPQIIESHQGMTEGHPRRGVAHDFLDAPLSLTPLATGATILTVARMPMRARSRSIERALYGFAAFRTHARRILDAFSMVTPAVDAADCLQRSSIFRTVSHEAKYKRSRAEPGGVSRRPRFPTTSQRAATTAIRQEPAKATIAQSGMQRLVDHAGFVSDLLINSTATTSEELSLSARWCGAIRLPSEAS